MQALSHFTYHKTDRQLMLVDLQGCVIPGGVILTDLVILSRTRSYWVTDLGPNGISNLFSHHVCTDVCRRPWKVHPNPVRYYAPTRETTMEKVPPAAAAAAASEGAVAPAQGPTASPPPRMPSHPPSPPPPPPPPQPAVPSGTQLPPSWLSTAALTEPLGATQDVGVENRRW